jgi:hypothetical protein
VVDAALDAESRRGCNSHRVHSAAGFDAAAAAAEGSRLQGFARRRIREGADPATAKPILCGPERAGYLVQGRSSRPKGSCLTTARHNDVL